MLSMGSSLGACATLGGSLLNNTTILFDMYTKYYIKNVVCLSCDLAIKTTQSVCDPCYPMSLKCFKFIVIH